MHQPVFARGPLVGWRGHSLSNPSRSLSPSSSLRLIPTLGATHAMGLDEGHHGKILRVQIVILELYNGGQEALPKLLGPHKLGSPVLIFSHNVRGYKNKLKGQLG